MEQILYKYLDVKGGISMLYNSDLMFTNATQLNDPFDCHPCLIDFSNVPKEKCKGWGADVIKMIESSRYVDYRDKTWVCSLSKVYDSLLMWSYYNAHRGVCVGIDMEKAASYLSKMYGSVFLGCMMLEVQYRDILSKPDCFRGCQD